MESSYRLRRVAGGLMHAVDVAVRVEPSGQDEIVVSDEVWVWRRGVYGPDARWGGPADRAMVAEAVAGVRHVLDRVAGSGRRVTVTSIHDTPVDTGVGDVKLAAALATCQALGVDLDRPPFLDASGVVFPD